MSRVIGDAVVFADPRSRERITFRAYCLPLPSGRVSRHKTIAFFDIPDNYRKDLSGQFDRAFTRAMERAKSASHE
jgi:hypothetical protein